MVFWKTIGSPVFLLLTKLRVLHNTLPSLDPARTSIFACHNSGLDLGLLITAALAALPAGASAQGCGYSCFVVLCFPCAPGGGVGMATVMVLTTLALSFAAGFKMWLMAPALLAGATREESFLPW